MYNGGNDDERQRAVAFLQFEDVQPCAVGNPAISGGDAETVLTVRAADIRKSRAGLRKRALPREEVMRKGQDK